MADGAHNNLLSYCHLTSCMNYIFAHENHLSITFLELLPFFLNALHNSRLFQAHASRFICLRLFKNILILAHIHKLKTVQKMKDMENIYCDS